MLITRPTLEAALEARDSNSFIGAGMNREVYRLPNDFWAYKFENSLTYANENEYENYLKIKDDLPLGIAVPRMELLEVDEYGDSVLATEFIVGDREPNNCGINNHFCTQDRKSVAHGLPDCWAEIVGNSYIPIYDIHNENVIHHNGMIYIIDLEA